MNEQTRERPWLTALKRIAPDVSDVSANDRRDTSWIDALTSPISRTDNTDERVSQRAADDATDDDSEVAWRLAAFRARIPTHGPVWPPRLRNTPLCDTPGYCSLCGDELAGDPVPRYRCVPCVRALWLALNTTREDVSTS